jgi:hypothetical protein
MEKTSQQFAANSGAAWWAYVKMRFPIPIYLLLSGGLALSGAAQAGGGEFAGGLFNLKTLASFLYAIWLFGTLRLMDELKDYDKDVIANPSRPMPQGWLTKPHVGRVIQYLMLIGMLGSFAFVLHSGWAAGLALVTTVWLWLMYREFYIGEALGKNPLAYAITHQIILIPFCLLMAASQDAGRASVMIIEDPHPWIPFVSREFLGAKTASVLAWSVAVLGSFFSFEVSRKQDADAHPVLATYRQTYGIKVSAIIVMFLTLIALAGALNTGLAMWMAPFSVLTFLSYILLLFRHRAHKVIEATATLSLFFHIWAPILNALIFGTSSSSN